MSAQTPAKITLEEITQRKRKTLERDSCPETSHDSYHP